MADKCVGGTRSILEVEQTGDCTECVGIASFVNNGDGTSTITLTNGQSYSFQSTGAAGATGATGATGAAGAVGPVGPTGPSGATNGNALLMSWITPTKYLNTGGVGFESMQNYSLAGNRVSTAQDEIKIHAVIDCDYTITPVVPTAPGSERQCSIFFGATDLLALAPAQMKAGNIHKIEIDVSITRLSANTASYEATVKYYKDFILFGNYVGGLNPDVFKQEIQNLAPDWTIANLLSVQVESPIADMYVSVFEVLINKFAV